MIGDCQPNADFRTVRADAAEEAYTLMDARCTDVADGIARPPLCENHVCVFADAGIFGCCGYCGESDAGRN